MKDRFDERRDRLRKLVKKADATAILVTDFTNVTYLTGFTGDDSYLLVNRDGAVLISDPRYTTQLSEECPGLDLFIRPPGVSMLAAVAKVVEKSKCRKLGVEGDSMTVGLREQIAAEMPVLEFATTSGLVEQLRQIKDAEEVAAIRKAIYQAERAFGVIRATLRPDKTEKQIADELDQQMRAFGAQGSGFPSIVAVGPRAALPHARPTDQTVGVNSLLLIDWGADGGLYRSDLTRVLATGTISPKLERIYGVVLKAQRAAIEAIRPGVIAGDVDRVAREIISQEGFGRNFGHGLGHGLGLQVHEAPRLAVNVSGELRPGMVVTVEPGIYLPGWGGVRIEDDVLVTRTGHEVLTSVPKQLEDIVVR
jgi:Xaa-Pro aminopeptidase